MAMKREGLHIGGFSLLVELAQGGSATFGATPSSFSGSRNDQGNTLLFLFQFFICVFNFTIYFFCKNNVEKACNICVVSMPLLEAGMGISDAQCRYDFFFLLG